MLAHLKILLYPGSGPNEEKALKISDMFTVSYSKTGAVTQTQVHSAPFGDYFYAQIAQIMMLW